MRWCIQPTPPPHLRYAPADIACKAIASQLVPIDSVLVVVLDASMVLFGAWFFVQVRDQIDVNNTCGKRMCRFTSGNPRKGVS